MILKTREEPGLEESKPIVPAFALALQGEKNGQIWGAIVR